MNIFDEQYGQNIIWQQPETYYNSVRGTIFIIIIRYGFPFDRHLLRSKDNTIH